MIIGLVGKKGSGKDTVANFIQEYLLSKEIISEKKQMAYSLKLSCSRLTQKPLYEFEDNSIKDLKYSKTLILDCDSVLSFLCDFGISSEVSSNIYEYLKDLNFSKEINSNRELLQFLGTDILRNMVKEDIHIDKAFEDAINSDKTFIYTDIRFENEAKYLKSLNNSFLIGIKRDLNNIDSHSSETGIDKIIEKHSNFVIMNSGSIEDLNAIVSSIVQRIS